MMQPKRRKFRKEQKGRNEGLATRGTKVSFGEWGLKATGRYWERKPAISAPQVSHRLNVRKIQATHDPWGQGHRGDTIAVFKGAR
jgi:ribosomal protein L16/L10AE